MNKYCTVPSCSNASHSMPNKLFISVPKKEEVRKKWCKAMKRDPRYPLSPKSTLFVCEDHFNLKEDMENYLRFTLMGGKLHIKKGVVPHIFPKHITAVSQIAKKFPRKRYIVPSIVPNSDTDQQNIIFSSYSTNDNNKIKQEYELDDSDNINNSEIDIKYEICESRATIKEEYDTDSVYANHDSTNLQIKTEYDNISNNENDNRLTANIPESSIDNIVENNFLIGKTTNEIDICSQYEFVSVNISEEDKQNFENESINGNRKLPSTDMKNTEINSNSYLGQYYGILHEDEILPKWFITCMVPKCGKTKKYHPDKHFIQSPITYQWEAWLKAVKVNADILVPKAIYFICEDHFDLPNDMENWEQFQNSGCTAIMKSHVVPSQCL